MNKPHDSRQDGFGTPRAIRVLALLLATAGAAACAFDGASTEEEVGEVTEALYGGKETSNQRLVVGFYGETGRCSGVIVSRDAVVTAAHCVTPGKLAVGVYRQTATGDPLTCLTPAANGGCASTAVISRHPDYAKRGDRYDVGVIRFKTDFFANLGMTKGDMPWIQYSTPGSDDGTVWGYGQPSGAWSVRWANWSSTASNGFLVEHDDKVSLCPGDNGGPIFSYQNVGTGIPGYLIGVNGWSASCDGKADTKAVQLVKHRSYLRHKIGESRCEIKTFTATTPPPQEVITLMRCF